VPVQARVRATSTIARVVLASVTTDARRRRSSRSRIRSEGGSVASRSCCRSRRARSFSRSVPGRARRREPLARHRHAESAGAPSGLRLGSKVALADGKKARVLRLEASGSTGDMELVQVPAGEFIHGRRRPEAYDWEKPRHVHPIARRLLDRPERRDAGAVPSPSAARRGGRSPRSPGVGSVVGSRAKEDIPIALVSWDDRQGLRGLGRAPLPTEPSGRRRRAGRTGGSTRGEDWIRVHAATSRMPRAP